MGCQFSGEAERTELEEAIGTGRLMTQCPELDLKCCGYVANILGKLEIQSPESRLLMQPGPGSGSGDMGTAHCVTGGDFPLCFSGGVKGVIASGCGLSGKWHSGARTETGAWGFQTGG